MTRFVVFGSREELKELLTESIRESPEYAAGAGDLIRRTLRFLLPVFATCRVPIVAAFDQLEDILTLQELGNHG